MLPLCGGFNGGTDAQVGPASADIPVHCRLDFFVGRGRVLFEECGGVHDLAGLAIPALGYVVLDPGLLQRMRSIFREPLDGGDWLVANRRYRYGAGTDRTTVQMNRAGATLSDPAAKLGPYEVEMIA